MVLLLRLHAARISTHRALVIGATSALLCATTVTTVSAQQQNQGGQNDNGNQGGNVQGQYPFLASTPELDSLLLFGSGAAGLAAYGMTRLRARRKA
jgi:hypothetical protein